MIKVATAISRIARRAAIGRRDARFDGAFVFAVRSTGIYCQPSCPARRPRPERILFFDTPEAAERSGFRPCRRCHPRSAAGASDPAAMRVARLCREIDRAIAEEPEQAITLSWLGERSGMGVHAIERTFRKHLGLTPRQYADARRLGELKSRLRGGSNVTEALYDAGYGSSSRLYERAPSQLGMTPLTYRRGGNDMEIRFAVVSCPLGQLLVAATERGIAAVYLGDSKRKLRVELGREFAGAQIREDRKRLERWAAAIVKHLSDRRPLGDLPLDVQATAFQRRVWRELQRIPYGATRSYTEIARAIGMPRGARAVARAIATNPASIVIPCHRVIGKNGKLTGYRWGNGRKRALLGMEKAAIDGKRGAKGRGGRPHSSAPEGLPRRILRGRAVAG